ETRFVRDLEAVPVWCRSEDAPTPRTVSDANFVESRLHSLRTRNSAAYKGVMAILMGNKSKDWMEAKEFGAYQYKEMDVTSTTSSQTLGARKMTSILSTESPSLIRRC